MLTNLGRRSSAGKESFMYMMKNKLIQTFILCVCCILVITIFFPADSVNAQDETGDWSAPYNVSFSGGAVNPSSVIDSRGVVHLIWEDVFSGFLYSQMTNNAWTIPEKVFFPFLPISTTPQTNITNTSPILISNGKGVIHAFWLDSRKVLYHSYVIEYAFNQSSSWLPRQVISEAVNNFNVISDAQGNIHLVYIRSSSSSFEKSGVLYRKQSNGIWQTPVQIFESNYFRLLSADESNVQVETVENENGQRIYVFWDNRPSNSVMGAFSDDLGLTWSDEYVVDGPSPQRETERLIEIKSSANGNKIILVWKSDQLGQSCTQYYQYSEDGGLTWQEKLPIINSLVGCVSDFDIMAGSNGLFVMSSNLLGLEYLSIWNGQNWSEPRQQAILTNYIDPSNYNLITFSSDFLLMMPENKLAAVATSSTDEFQGDIWWMTRDLGDVADWIAAGTNWSTFERVTGPSAPQLDSDMSADNKGRVHLVTIADPTNVDTLIEKEIFYSRWDGGEWSVHAGVINSPEGKAGSISLVANMDNQLAMVWNDTRGTSLYFSSASADRALNSSEWSQPVRIGSVGNVYNDPEIIVTNQNDYYVIFSVPVNEGRGIYLVKSLDGGINWEPSQVIAKGEEYQWLKVGNPNIASVNGNKLFAIWKVYPYLENLQYSELYYSSSFDSGNTWTPPLKLDEGIILDEEITNDGFGNVNRYWRKIDGVTTNLIHSFSSSGGNRWVVSPVISLVNEPISNSTKLEVGFGGAVSLVQVTEDISSGDWGINTWNWEGGKWMVADSNNIRLEGSQDIFGVDAAINSLSEKEVVVLFSEPRFVSSTTSDYSFYSTYRDIKNEEEINTELPEMILQPTAIVETIEPSFNNAPTPVDLSAFETTTRSESESNTGLIIGIGAGFLVVALFVFIQLRPKKNN